MIPRAIRWATFGVGLLGLAFLAARDLPAANPDILWNIVNGRCVPDALAHREPLGKPCLAVDLRGGVARGTALIKDINGATQLLLLPTARVTGIESPALLQPDAPNYFAAAWQARTYLHRLAGRTPARDAVALAINSSFGRTQNQLHIHIDCLRADVRAALKQYAGETTDAWKPFPVPLAGHPYLAMRVAAADLTANPFDLLADKLPVAKADMGRWTLVVAGAELGGGKPGFLLLADHVGATPGDRASGEELQDHQRACRWRVVSGISPALRAASC